MNTAQQAGGALGLAVLYLLARPNGADPHALVHHYNHAFQFIAVALVVVAVVALTLPTTRESTGNRV